MEIYLITNNGKFLLQSVINACNISVSHSNIACASYGSVGIWHILTLKYIAKGKKVKYKDELFPMNWGRGGVFYSFYTPKIFFIHIQYKSK